MLVNEATPVAEGQFVTTNLVATQSFLAAHPTVVSGLLKGQIQANSFIHSNKSAGRGRGQRRAGLAAAARA